MARGPQFGHWQVQDPKKELSGWSTEAAELLGKIPVSAVESVLNVSAAATVAVGLGSMVMGRVAIDRQIAAAIAADRKHQEALRQQQEQPAESAPAGATFVQEGTVQGDTVRSLFPDAWQEAGGF